MSDEFCVFLTGQQRSGTSLLRSLLNNAEALTFYPADLDLWQRAAQQDRVEGGHVHRLAHREFSRLRKHKKAYAIRHLLSVDSGENEQWQHGVGDLSSIRAWLLRSYAAESGARFWGFKKPELEYEAPYLIERFPSARFVHLVRDPRDAGASQRKKYRYDTCGHIMKWKRSTRLALALQDQYPGRFLISRYEDLVQCPEATMEKVCHFLGIPYTQQMLNPDGLKAWGGANSSHARHPDNPGIYDASIGRYHEILSPWQCRLYRKMLEGELLRFGYPVEAEGSWLGCAGADAIVRAGSLRAYAFELVRTAGKRCLNR